MYVVIEQDRETRRINLVVGPFATYEQANLYKVNRMATDVDWNWDYFIRSPLPQALLDEGRLTS